MNAQKGPSISQAAGFTERDLLLILAYCWFLAVVPLFIRREDPLIQWHARNGLALFLVEALLLIVLVLLGLPILLIFKAAGLILVSAVLFLAWLLLLGVHLWCMRAALHGERVLLPVLSQWAERI